MKKFPTIQGKYASIKVLTKKGLEVKIVFCRIENANKWGAVLSTDIDLSSEEILNIYIKRWTIEPFLRNANNIFILVKNNTIRNKWSLSLFNHNPCISAPFALHSIAILQSMLNIEKQ
jgi:hypothetical protein